MDGERRYRMVKREVQRAARRDKARWFEERCEEVQEDLKNNNSIKAFELIKTLKMVDNRDGLTSKIMMGTP